MEESGEYWCNKRLQLEVDKFELICARGRIMRFVMEWTNCRSPSPPPTDASSVLELTPWRSWLSFPVLVGRAVAIGTTPSAR